MKEHAQEYGVRRWAGDDLVELQSEPLEAIQKLVEPYAPCIIQGCEVNATEKRIEPGMVALWELDEENRKKGVKIARFEGCVTETFPVYLTLKRTPEERVYVDGKNKPIAYDYTAQETTVENDVKDKFPLKITEDGGPRLPESLTVNFTAATIRENIQPKETLGTAFGKIRKWFSDLKALAFKEKVSKEDLAETLKNEIDGKSNNGHTHTNATTSSAGFMSKEDKEKLDGIATGANKTEVDTALSATSTKPVQNKVVKEELDKKAPALDSETAWKMIRALGNKVCLSTSTTDAISTASYGRGAYRNSSEEAVAFLVKQSDDWEIMCLIGTTASSVTIRNDFGGGPNGSSTSYTDNKNIWQTGEGLYINLMNMTGGLKEGVFRLYRNSTTSYTTYRTIVRINFSLTVSNGVITAAVREKIRNTCFAPLLVAAATGWSPNATASADGFMSAADKTKLDGIASGANNYIHPTYTTRTGYPTANQTPGFGSTFSVSQVTSDASGHVSGLTTRTVKIPATLATTSANGLMSATDKKQLTDFQIVGIYFIAQGIIEYGFKSVTLKTRQSTHGGEKCIYIMMPSETGTYMILPFAPQSQHYITTYNNRWDAGIEAIVFHRDPSGKAGYFGFGVPFLLIKTTLTLKA